MQAGRTRKAPGHFSDLSRVLEVPCRERGSSKFGTHKVLVYYADARTLRVHFTNYWHCSPFYFFEVGPDSVSDEDMEPEAQSTASWNPSVPGP